MSLWADKYRPCSLSRLDYHKEQAAQLRNLVSGRGGARGPARPSRAPGTLRSRPPPESTEAGRSNETGAGTVWRRGLFVNKEGRAGDCRLSRDKSHGQ